MADSAIASLALLFTVAACSAPTVDVALPSTERFRLLKVDGRVNPAVEIVRLRAGEAAIVVKDGRVSVAATQ
jgi:hypothetical protein